MIEHIYSVYDKVSEVYTQPLTFKSKGEAERWFRTKIKNDTMFRDNKSDFELYKIGEFDTLGGFFTNTKTKLALKGDSINV